MHIWERHFPLAPMAKPTTTARSWHARTARYKAWRDAVRLMVGPPDEALVPPFALRILLLEWSPAMDPDNIEKALLDALKPWPLPDDTNRVIAHLSITRTRASVKDGGFSVTLWHWDGLRDGRESPEAALRATLAR